MYISHPLRKSDVKGTIICLIFTVLWFLSLISPYIVPLLIVFYLVCPWAFFSAYNILIIERDNIRAVRVGDSLLIA